MLQHLNTNHTESKRAQSKVKYIGGIAFLIMCHTMKILIEQLRRSQLGILETYSFPIKWKSMI